MYVFVVALIATVNCVGVRPPLRRFYIYNPDFLPHAAAALNMLVQPALYEHAHYPHSYDDDHEDVEEYSEQSHDSQPLQLLTLIKPKQQKKRVKKRRPNGTRVKRIKKGSKKCMPFKLRFRKKIDGGVPFTYLSQLRAVRRARPSSAWGRMSRWRVAEPGSSVTEYPLQEPIPSVSGGTPPASLLYNIYEDNRIPLTSNLYHDPDYYQDGVYQTKTEASTNFNLTGNVVVYSSNGSTERIVTVTPTTAWVPLPKYYRVTQTVSRDDGDNVLLTKRCSLDECWESSNKMGLHQNKTYKISK
ncbi:hypothetical protein FQR65_LT01952 [Abscondita terminalis]|nr:hypothetical protein FQR65_LT01952 [Abscondita terminalis]